MEISEVVHKDDLWAKGCRKRAWVAYSIFFSAGTHHVWGHLCQIAPGVLVDGSSASIRTQEFEVFRFEICGPAGIIVAVWKKRKVWWAQARPSQGQNYNRIYFKGPLRVSFPPPPHAPSPKIRITTLNTSAWCDLVKAISFYGQSVSLSESHS